MSLDLFRFLPRWSLLVGLGGCALVTAIIVFGGRDW